MVMPNRSPADPPAGATHARGSARRAGALLLAGAALAVLASFLQLGVATYPPQGGDPGAAVTTIPAQPLLAIARIPIDLLAPVPLVELLGLWGLPLALAAMGTSALLAPTRRRTRRSANVAVTLACVGLFSYALQCLYFVVLNRFLGPAVASIAFGIGPVVAGAGYVCAFAGADGLPTPVRASAQSRTG